MLLSHTRHIYQCIMEEEKINILLYSILFYSILFYPAHHEAYPARPASYPAHPATCLAPPAAYPTLMQLILLVLQPILNLQHTVFSCPSIDSELPSA
jgi:hypothetical protein